MIRTETEPSPGDVFDWSDVTALGYERHLVPIMFAPFAERLVENMAPAPGARVLDLACGTGIVARTVASRIGGAGVITGVDLNTGMLEVARTKAQEQRLPILWKTADITKLPFPGSAFDVAFCQQGLQFFPDRVQALGEVHRVLAPGGRLAFSVWRPPRHNIGVAHLVAVLEKHAGHEVAEIMQVPYPDLDAQAVGDLARQAGFRNVRVRVEAYMLRFHDADHVLTAFVESTPLRVPVAALPPDTRAAMVRDLAERLEDHRDDDGVAWSQHTYVVTATK